MLRPSPNHGTQRLPNDDDDDGYYMLLQFIIIYTIFLFGHSHFLACIARYVHNLLVIICFLFTCAHSLFRFCLTFHIVF